MSVCSAQARRQRLLPGLLLAFCIVAMALALILANSPYSRFYDGLVDTQMSLTALGLGTRQSPLFWLNELFMAGVFCWTAWQANALWSATRSAWALSRRGLVGSAAVAALVPAGLLMLQKGEWSGRWLAAGAADPLFVWAVLGALGGIALQLRSLLVGWLALQNLCLLVVAHAGLYADFFAKPAMLAVALMALAALIHQAEGNGRGWPICLLLGAAWWLLLRAGLPGTLAAAQLGWQVAALAGSGARPSARLANAVTMLAATMLAAMLLANTGVSLRGVDPAYILQLNPLSAALIGTVLKPLLVWVMLVTAARCCEVARLGLSPVQLAALALLCGLGLSGQLYFAGLHHQVGNYLFDHRLAALWGVALILVLAWPFLAQRPNGPTAQRPADGIRAQRRRFFRSRIRKRPGDRASHRLRSRGLNSPAM